MMNEDTLKICLVLGTGVAKEYEQARILASNEQDGRFNNWCTQLYGLLQDIQDKIREDNVDGPVQIGSAPNLPTQNSANGIPNPTVPTPAPTGNAPTSGNPSGNPTGNGAMGCATPLPQGTPNSQQVADFFTQVLAGKASTNGDFDDLLNQMMAAQQAQNQPNNNQNQANF